MNTGRDAFSAVFEDAKQVIWQCVHFEFHEKAWMG